MSKRTPSLNIPPSDTTVSVSIIDTTSHIGGISLDAFITPPIKGFTALDCPAFSFLIRHPSGRTLLFDLGVRKDIENFPPRIADRIGKWDVTVEKDVRSILEENGVDYKGVESIIWSHWHWDHTGDPSRFDKSTSLIVGPGFKKAFLPAYPTKEDSPLADAYFEGRDVIEVEFDGGLKIGRFEAKDWFGDGSFWLLDSPGHAIGHLCGLARVKKAVGDEADSFIFMGGDACHHGGEFRPSQWLTLPDTISPHPFDRSSSKPCPGELFEHLLRDGDKGKAFYGIPDLPPEKAVAHDRQQTIETIEKVQETDANDNVFVVMAHDDCVHGIVDFFPKPANDFREKGWVGKTRWAFLKDFKEAAEDKDYKRERE